MALRLCGENPVPFRVLIFGISVCFVWNLGFGIWDFAVPNGRPIPCDGRQPGLTWLVRNHPVPAGRDLRIPPV